jgi:hypothetical protein
MPRRDRPEPTVRFAEQVTGIREGVAEEAWDMAASSLFFFALLRCPCVFFCGRAFSRFAF